LNAREPDRDIAFTFTLSRAVASLLFCNACTQEKPDRDIAFALTLSRAVASLLFSNALARKFVKEHGGFEVDNNPQRRPLSNLIEKKYKAPSTKL
jgi:hypothetical protein